MQAQLDDAREKYEREMDRFALGAAGDEEAGGGEELDLGPMLQETINKLWARPYEARVFTLQLLKASPY